ncbi:MAG: FimB/Mfa2 family fimbrial subunit [Muribaculaceae bacterium]|nr:FimB/Mfa2 family fimbrial subunit [Muribaculaceae bacterium]
MHIANLKSKLTASLVILAGMLTSGCTMVTDDLDPCPAQLRIKFVYDYNIKWGDAFLHEVPSVNVWAFNSSGALVWNASATVPADAKDGFYLDTPLPEGDYDFVAWCGIKDNPDFDLATYTPASKEELEVTMKTVEENGLYKSAVRLTPLFHADMTDIEYEVNPTAPTQAIVTASLMKDTKDIRVILRNMDGSEIENQDFTVTVTVPDNSQYAWNNSLLPSHTVTYEPWDIRYGMTNKPEDTDINGGESRSEGGRAVNSIATLVFDLSTGRLMENSKAILKIKRNWDNRVVVNINLIEYLLLIKGHYGDISDQEYLDRQDDYSIAFFIDPRSDYYTGNIVFINGWAVVPPQEEGF